MSGMQSFQCFSYFSDYSIFPIAQINFVFIVLCMQFACSFFTRFTDKFHTSYILYFQTLFTRIPNYSGIYYFQCNRFSRNCFTIYGCRCQNNKAELNRILIISVLYMSTGCLWININIIIYKCEGIIYTLILFKQKYAANTVDTVI